MDFGEMQEKSFCKGQRAATESGTVAERQRCGRVPGSFPFIARLRRSLPARGAGVVDIAVGPCLIGHPVIDDHLGLTGIILLKNFTVQQAFFGKRAGVGVLAALLGKVAVV